MAKKTKKSELTAKQERFCREYVIDCNGKQAAIRAGYSPKTAQAQSSQNLSKLKVKQRVAELQAKIADKLEITAEKVLKEYAKIGFVNIEDFIDESNNIVTLKNLKSDKLAAVESIQTTVNKTTNKTGEKEYETENVKLKFHSKISALNDLSKHLGLFEADNKQQPERSVINIS